jgi:disulfide bond formation protein DsbB
MNQTLTKCQKALGATTIVAVIATAGSLWFSIGLGLRPCPLCWYQRILMYPLTVILAVATIENRGSVYRTALPLSTIGTALAGYHSYLQMTVSSCSMNAPCGAVLWESPFLTLSIPNLSLVAFAIITGVLVAGRQTWH